METKIQLKTTLGSLLFEFEKENNSVKKESKNKEEKNNEKLEEVKIDNNENEEAILSTIIAFRNMILTHNSFQFRLILICYHIGKL